MDAIKVENLRKVFGNFVAVNDLSFSIKKGEIFGLLGPNGSGKSTTIRMLCGVMTPTAGEGTILGYNIIDETEKIKAKIGYMSQHFGLYGDLTVTENINFYGNIFGVSKKEIAIERENLIKLVALEGKENALARTLSGGMKQRLALACALIHNPSLLVLDEPTAGVDPVSRREFWLTITKLAKEGVTILVTTHYMDEATVCDRIAFIYRGSIISVNTLEGHLNAHGKENLEDVFIEHVLNKNGRDDIISYEAMRKLYKE